MGTGVIGPATVTAPVNRQLVPIPVGTVAFRKKQNELLSEIIYAASFLALGAVAY